MEHVPIKKRRFFLRSPSPTPQSPKHCEESQKLDSGMCTIEQQTYVKGNTEQEAALNDFSGSLCKKRVMDGDVQNAPSFFNGVPISNEDLTGTAIVGAAACSGELDGTVVDVDRTKMGDLPKSDDNETLDSSANVTDESNTTIDDGLCQIKELSGSEPTELIVSEVSRVKTTECCELPGTANNVVPPSETIPFDLPNKDVEITGNTTETSDAPINDRLHWDLNTIMDDWDHPVDDTFAGSCMTSAEVAQTSAMSIQKSVHVEMLSSRERAVASDGGDTLGDQSISYVMPESKTGSDMSISSLDVSSDHVTSHLRGTSSVHGTRCAIERDNMSNAQGYDGNLEDGELRESVGHGWEDKEIEDAETEHVDYDSDDREGIFLEAAEDSSRLCGEALAGDCGKQKFTLDNRVEEDWSQHQSCLSTHDQESPSLKSLSGARLGDCKGYGRSNSETDRLGKDVSDDALRDSRDERRLPCSDRRSADSIRSRSCHLGSEGRDRNMEVSEDSSFRVCRPRMISTSRSGYYPMRKGSPGERDDFHDKRMVNSRDIYSDRNSRSKFDRFSGGISREFKGGYHRQGMTNNFGKGERSFSPRENRIDSHYPRNQQKYGSRSRSRSPQFRSEARMGRERLPHHPPGHFTNHITERSPGRVFNQRPRFNAMSSPGRLRSNDGPISDPDYEETDEYRRKPRFVHSNRRSRSRSRSFSPDFRSDARGGPMRPPYQPTRGRGRGRRSFGRGFRQDQRFDNGESRGRFNDNPQSGRGNGYCNGGDEYRRKPQNIFERIQPVRHYDKDRDGRQFQYNERFNLNRNFRRNESYSRGGYKRAVEFRNEERSDIIYDSDRMFSSGPKQFGDGTLSRKEYSNECEYLKIPEEQLKASPAIQQDVTPSLQESQVEPVSQSQAQPTIVSSLPENSSELQSSVQDTTTPIPSVGPISES